ncbi:hypothetical protein IEO21_01640 [Rhodonia placenta]|uniref:Uncharacterized protein n=1 Tax=Rhodonia placenta TaxID=104341 RepID=A0A8H7P9L2_9APHY|nr:hypothetical protein IEO21_01640 [Postia placenta]
MSSGSWSSQQTHRPVLPPNPTAMCNWRRVRNHYKRCGHYIDLVRPAIKCEDRYCKFSPAHPPDCVPPECTKRCWQYHQFPEQYNPVIDNICPSCIQIARAQAAAR